MTQLTFDFSAGSGFSVGGGNVALLVRENSRDAPVDVDPPVKVERLATSSRKTRQIRTGQSVSLYDSGRKDLHHIGDLAKSVIDRYEIVHRRRAARLAREKAARDGASSQPANIQPSVVRPK